MEFNRKEIINDIAKILLFLRKRSRITDVTKKKLKFVLTTLRQAPELVGYAPSDWPDIFEKKAKEIQLPVTSKFDKIVKKYFE